MSKVYSLLSLSLFLIFSIGYAAPSCLKGQVDQLAAISQGMQEKIKIECCFNVEYTGPERDASATNFWINTKAKLKPSDEKGKCKLCRTVLLEQLSEGVSKTLMTNAGHNKLLSYESPLLNKDMTEENYRGLSIYLNSAGSDDLWCDDVISDKDTLFDLSKFKF